METVKSYTLDPNTPQIVFVLGGPGSGKGTQCERLVRDYHYYHISVGDVIREEAENGGPDSERLKQLMSQGALVSDELVVSLLDRKIKNQKAQKYLIDGFPRNISQAKLLERKIKEIDLILDIHVGEEVLVERLLERAKTSGRVDDNPESIKKRIHTFHEATEPVLEYYRKFGKIKRIDGTKSIDEVYKQVRRAIKPNIIFFWGPPAVGKTTVARTLAEKTKYLYIDFEKFVRDNRLRTEQEKTNKLIEYCDTVPHMCILVDSFFTDVRQAQIFFDHFVEPQIVFYLDAPRDEVIMNIARYYPNERDRNAQRRAYEEYLRQRDDLLALIEKRAYFRRINAADTLQGIVQQCLQVYRPLTLVSFKHHNVDLAAQYHDRLEKERGFIYCNMEDLSQSEQERETATGRLIGAYLQSGQRVAPKLQVDLVSKIIFNAPENKRFVFTEFPEDQQQFSAFESDLYPVDYLLSFQREGQKHEYKSKPDPLLHYFAQGKLIDIDRPALDIVDSYITPRAKYGFVTGSPVSGKSTLAQHLAKQFEFELVEWDKLIEELKVKLGTEDGPLEEVTYAQVENWLAARLDPALKKTTTVLFDGFPYDVTNLKNFVTRVGIPTFALQLAVPKDALVRRYRLKNEIEGEAELDEDTTNKINDYLAKGETFNSFWKEYAQKNYGFTLYNVDASISLDSTKRAIESIFYKRVFLVSDYINGKSDAIQEQKQNLKLMFINICRRDGITFVDVPALIQKASKNAGTPQQTRILDQFAMRWSDKRAEFPSNYTPDLVVTIIKNFLQSLKKQTRDVLLFGYPAADTNSRDSSESWYPRAGDELYQIERYIGPVRIVVAVTQDRINYAIDDPEWVLEKPQEKEAKRGDEEGGEEDAKNAEEGGEEEAKNKFNIYDYKWTNSNGQAKSLSQWYVKSKKTQRIRFSLGKNGFIRTYEKFKDFLSLINEESEQNKEELDYRKTNLFLQLSQEIFEGQEIEEDPVDD